MPATPETHPIAAQDRALARGGWCPTGFRRRIALSVIGALAVTGVLGLVLGGRRGQFASALDSAPIWLLALAVLLQLAALLSRTEAWNICVRAAGGTVSRRQLFRAAGVGYMASVLNGSLGMAVRIGSLRRAAPAASPGIPALLAAEVPILAVEVSLAAIFSFTLVGPLGVAWWLPVIAVAVIAGAVAMLRRFSNRHRAGLWAGLAILRKAGRVRMTGFVLLSVCAQIARNWLMLHAIGVEVSVFDAMALLIAMFTLGQLPIGPSMGAAAAVLILGVNGIAVTAAAGVLLAVTGTVGSLCYAAWAIADRVIAGVSSHAEDPTAPPVAASVAAPAAVPVAAPFAVPV